MTVTSPPVDEGTSIEDSGIPLGTVSIVLAGIGMIALALTVLCSETKSLTPHFFMPIVSVKKEGVG
ncbi:MAG: hypothetical protein ACETVN_02205 [Asgard group archaeon]